MDLALLGLGQIGGSIGRAALANGVATRVIAWTPSGHGPAAAAKDGIVPAADLGAAIAGADLVVLAAPPLACLELLDRLGSLPAEVLGDAVVTDVASTKAEIVERAATIGLRFVGGHPMAGREAVGYEASDPDLFRDRPWIVVPPPGADGEAVALLEALATGCGARPVRMDPLEHDAAVALISHAPLVVAAALVEAAAARPDWPVARDIAAGGWASMTRLARGNVEMGAGILATNCVATATALRAFAARIESWAELLERGPQSAEITERLAAARDAAGDR